MLLQAIAFYVFAFVVMASAAMVVVSRNPVYSVLFLILAYFLRFAQSGKSMLDPMQSDAYGMFLVHYPIALWLQYWLFDYNIPATVKAPIGFVLTVAFSWALTRALRQIPGAKRVL